jgi:hypothetical protein
VRIVAYSCLMMLCAHTVALAGWFSYDSYEDCMLGRMKGQPQMMYLTADKACKKEFGVEFNINKSLVKWDFNGDLDGKRVEISITSSDEYEITSGEFSFSEKSGAPLSYSGNPCQGLTEADFDKPAQLQFINGKAKVPFNMTLTCARAVSFTGKYK